MTQMELHQAVAQATGESVAIIARLGFGIADPSAAYRRLKPRRHHGRIVDWDALDATRPSLFPSWRRR